MTLRKFRIESGNGNILAKIAVPEGTEITMPFIKTLFPQLGKGDAMVFNQPECAEDVHYVVPNCASVDSFGRHLLYNLVTGAWYAIDRKTGVISAPYSQRADAWHGRVTSTIQ